MCKSSLRSAQKDHWCQHLCSTAASLTHPSRFSISQTGLQYPEPCFSSEWPLAAAAPAPTDRFRPHTPVRLLPCQRRPDSPQQALPLQHHDCGRPSGSNSRRSKKGCSGCAGRLCNGWRSRHVGRCGAGAWARALGSGATAALRLAYPGGSLSGGPQQAAGRRRDVLEHSGGRAVGVVGTDAAPAGKAGGPRCTALGRRHRAPVSH